MNEYSRRRLLQVGGAGTAVAVAGCGALDSNDDEMEPEETDQDGTDDTESVENGDEETEVEGYTVAAAPDEEELAALEQELQAIQEEAMAGEISQEEAEAQRAEVNEEIDELISETISGIEGHISGTDAVSIVDSLAERGALLVDGEAAELLSLVDREDVNALYSSDVFVQAQQQGQP